MARQGFNYSAAMQAVCRDIVRHVDDLNHIRMEQVLIAVSQTRGAKRVKTYASLTGLRFPGGERVGQYKGHWCRIPEYRHERHEILYIMRFYLPRFQDMSFDFKLETIIHELWHIGPAFDGDHRRFPGRKCHHGSAADGFDREVRRLRAAYLGTSPDPDCLAFLKTTFDELHHRHGSVYGLRVRHPRLEPVPPPERQASTTGD